MRLRDRGVSWWASAHGDRAALRPTLFICSVLDTGGAERHWETLIPALEEAGQPARLVAVKAGGRAFDSIAQSGIPARVLRGRGGLVSLAKLPHLLSESRARPGVVVSWGVDAHVLGTVVARRLKIPHLIHWHAGPGSTLSRSQRLALNLVARSGAGAIAVSKAQIGELNGFGFRSAAVRVAPAGVPDPAREFDTRASARSALGLSESAFIPLLVGRLATEKRVDRFVESVAKLRHKGVDAQGVVVGDGPELRRISAASQTAVKFVGFQRQPANFMIAADVVCLTSDREAMPLTLLEAAACGRATVAMDVGGVHEAVVDAVTGFVTPQGDVDTFVDVLTRLAADPGRAEALGERGRARWSQSFSVDTMVRWYLELLHEVGTSPIDGT